jgi:hypothetical protein
MDLSVNIHELKYNFEKNRGFCKNPGLQRFLRFMKLFSLMKSHRICPQHGGLSPWSRLTGFTTFIKYGPSAPRYTVEIKQPESFCYDLILSALL